MARTCERHFLGWSGSALASAADWILANLGEDLADIVVALPGGRACRKLGEHLARRAGPGWSPPRILTQGELIDEFTLLEQPAAGRLVRTLAWERALGELSPRSFDRLARRTAPGLSGGLLDGLQLAETVRGLHGQLAPEGVDFTELASGEARPESRGEALRWESLAEAQGKYRAVLAGVGLMDPHDARYEAIEGKRVDPGRRVVLVGVADMNHLLRRLLAEIGERATALVVAPEELADGFDELGAIVTDFWKSRDVPIPADRWHVAEKPVDQADAALAVLEGFSGRFRAEELTIGIADEQVTPYLERRLAGVGTTVRNAAGLAIERTRPYLLLSVCARFLERRRYGELAALVRHPDLEPRLRQDQGLFSRDPAAALDDYHLEHLPDHVDGRWVDDVKLSPAVREMHKAVLALLGGLNDGKRPLSKWSEAVRALLLSVYAERSLDPLIEDERVLAESLSIVGEALSELEHLPEKLVKSSVTAADAFALLMRQLRGASVRPRPARPGEPTVEFLGWLELPLDDAPALIVTGFNEGRVPQSIHGDAFLPNTVRSSLSLPDNEARLARDVYAASVLVNARDEVAFVTGRRSLEGDPLVPSRLAFHVPEEAIIERVRSFLPEEDGGEVLPAHADPEDEKDFSRPRLDTAYTPRTMGVSSFKTYLESPYGYYLKYVLRLKTLDDRARELDPLRFGNFAHDVLFAFGKSDMKDATGERDIRRCLERGVDRLVKERFGREPLPAIVLQAEQLKYRLGFFAARQADWAGRGWRIQHVEHGTPDEGVPLIVDGEAIGLRGRIDRIDRHPQWGWAVLDYKTGDKQLDPNDAHRTRGGDWKDLQLPLYHHIARSMGIEGDVQLGYVAIGKDEGAIGFRTVRDWTEDDVAAALKTAEQVVRDVRAGQFDEPGRGAYDEIFKALYGEGLITSQSGAEGLE